MKLRLQPIRVFCFHHVSDSFDESTMKIIDWMQTDEFKQAVEKLQKEGYVFISLPEAHEKLRHDIFRFRKYAVFTADDGWASLKNILPWLNERQIPVTLFLNPAYLDGKHFRERETEQYLTWNEVNRMHEQYPLVTMGSHGWEHVEVWRQKEIEFEESVRQSNNILEQTPGYIRFFAYPYGRYNGKGNRILKNYGLIPVYVNGEVNYNNVNFINRELLK